MDGTLYDNPAYMEFQELSQVRRLAEFKRVGIDEAKKMLADSRAARSACGELPTSMARHFLALGVSMPDIVRWRIEDIRPEQWLAPDPGLDTTLGLLARAFSLGLLTNNPRAVGEAALVALGIRRHFKAVAGLDDSGESKPSLLPFRFICDALGLHPSECVSIGDRESVDGEPALALGMGAIIVSSVRDIYRLPRLLESVE